MKSYKHFFIVLACLMPNCSFALNQDNPTDCNIIKETFQEFLAVLNSDTLEQGHQGARKFDKNYPDFIPKVTSKRSDVYEFDFDGDGKQDKIIIQKVPIA